MGDLDRVSTQVYFSVMHFHQTLLRMQGRAEIKSARLPTGANFRLPRRARLPLRLLKRLSSVD